LFRLFGWCLVDFNQIQALSQALGSHDWSVSSLGMLERILGSKSGCLQKWSYEGSKCGERNTHSGSCDGVFIREGGVRCTHSVPLTRLPFLPE